MKMVFDSCLKVLLVLAVTLFISSSYLTDGAPVNSPDLEDAEDHLLKVLLDRKLERNYSKRGTAWRFGKRDDNSFLLRDIKNLLDNASGKPYPDTEIGYKDKYLTAEGFGRPEGYTNDKRGTAWRFG